MVLADGIAYDTCRLLVGLAVRVAKFAHGVENASMHRLQAVSRIRQSPADNNAHRVIDERYTHLLLDVDVLNSFEGLLCFFFVCH